MNKCAAIILAAGKGTRMKSDRAKALQPFAGAPLLAHSLKRAKELGADPTILVIGHQAEAVKKASLERWNSGVLSFALQRPQLGTGHAVKAALKALRGFKGQVLITYCDVPLITGKTLSAFMIRALESKCPLTLMSCIIEKPTGYGRVIRSGVGRAAEVIEERDATDGQRRIKEINVGLYIADAAFLSRAVRQLKNDNDQGEYYLTDIVAVAAGAGGAAIYTLTDAEEMYGVNSQAELAAVESIYYKKRARALKGEGVNIRHQASTKVDFDAVVERGAILERGATIAGRSLICSGARVGAGARIIDSSLGEGVKVGREARLRDCIIEGQATIGQGAVLKK